MKPSITIVDTRGFTGMCQELSKRSGTPIKNVILARTASVLSRCIEWTPRASREKIKTSVEFRNRSLWSNGDPDNPKRRGDQIGYITKKGVQWFADESNWDGRTDKKRGYSGPKRKMGSKSFHDMNGFQHWANDRWSRWQEILDKMRAKQIDVKAALRSIGVAKATWLQIARALGIEGQLKGVPGYVKLAVPRNGKIYFNGTARKVDTPEQFYVEISNSQPTVVNKLGGASILSRAIQSNVAGFNNDMKRAVLNDIKTRAQRYPGIFVS